MQGVIVFLKYCEILSIGLSAMGRFSRYNFKTESAAGTKK